MRAYIILLFLLLPGLVSAQVRREDLSGMWTGNYTGTLWEILDAKPERVVLALHVSPDNRVTGSAHLYHADGHQEHNKISGSWDPAARTMTFTEDSVLGLRLTEGHNCLGTYTMSLSGNAPALRLEGRWKDKEKGVLGCPSSSVYFTKARGPVEARPAPADSLLQRVPDVQSLVTLAPNERDGIRIEVMDDPEVDGDVVSIYQDDRAVVKKQKLTAKPYTFKVSMPRGAEYSRIRIAAEDLGSIPPCTAHLRITTAAGRRFDVDLSSTMAASGTLELFSRIP